MFNEAFERTTKLLQNSFSRETFRSCEEELQKYLTASKKTVTEKQEMVIHLLHEFRNMRAQMLDIKSEDYLSFKSVVEIAQTMPESEAALKILLAKSRYGIHSASSIFR